MEVCVVGGGAAGLMAAITAARRGGCVTLIERQSRVGRKLSATGNGRCNLSNEALAERCYHGAPAAFVRPALSALDTAGTLALFAQMGLLTQAEPGGRVYPLSDQAASVVDVLRFAADGAGVRLLTGTQVRSIRREKGGFSLVWDGGGMQAQRVIVCCGGAAGTHLGGSCQGYGLLTALGHTLTELSSALCPIRTETELVRSLKGVRAKAAAVLRQQGRPLGADTGEVQFTDTGVSGPTAFALSRLAGPGQVLHLDLLPGCTAAQVDALLRRRQTDLPQLTLDNLLTGILHNRLGRTVVRSAGAPLTLGVSALTEGVRRRIAGAVKDFALPVLGRADFSAAQVTAGGIRWDEFDPETLESRIVPGLFAAGEVLDVDGDCGGYNLQWAWSSGYLAGHLGAQTAKEACI